MYTNNHWQKNCIRILSSVIIVALVVQYGKAGLQLNLNTLKIVHSLFPIFAGISPYSCELLPDSMQAIAPSNVCQRISLITADNKKTYLVVEGDSYFQTPDSGSIALFIAGVVALDAGKRDKAIRLWQKDEGIETYLLNLARKYQNSEDKIRLYKLSIAVKPQPITFLELSKLYAQNGDNSAALQICETGINLFSQSSLVDPYLLSLIYQQSGHIYFDMGNYDNAVDQYTKALQLWPDLPEAISGLAKIDIARGNYQRAEKRLLNGLGIVSKKFWLNYWLAVIYQTLGDLDKSLYRVRLALDERDDFSAGWHLIGDIAVERGDRNLAIQAYQNYLMLTPDDVTIQNRLQQLMH